ncbi:MAG: hypothetical protein JWQ49_5917 [Edaphobacter sp.]|nr:hypothetical protein [Edaphobacter sp.]
MRELQDVFKTIGYPDGGQVSYTYPSSTEVDTTVLASPDPSVYSQTIVDSSDANISTFKEAFRRKRHTTQTVGHIV